MLGARSHQALPEHSPDLMLAQKYQVHDSVSLHTCRRNIIPKQYFWGGGSVDKKWNVQVQPARYFVS